MDRKSLNKVKSALRSELTRSSEGLRVPGQPKIYYLSYLFRDLDGYSVWGRLGSIWSRKPLRKRNVYADVRVGSYRTDQTTKGGLNDNSDDNDSVDFCRLPLEDDVDSLRYALWRLTDSKYREAVAAFHERQAHLIHYRDENASYPSFQKGTAERSSERLRTLEIDRDYWDDYVRRSSRALKKHTDFQNTYVSFTGRTTTKVFVSTEGSEIVWQSNEFSLVASLWMLTEKGEAVEMSVVRTVADAVELPALADFIKLIDAKVAAARNVSVAKTLHSYSGPVLFAPIPAGLFFHEVLGHRLEGNRMLSSDEGKTFADKIGKPVTHPDLDIYDDPTRKRFAGSSLVGAYPYDDEGTPSERVTLVEGGCLRRLLSSRAPLKSRGHQSNGHGRNESFQRPISRMGNLFIEARKGHSWSELKTLLIEEVRRRSLPYGIAILECEGGETETESYDVQAFMGEVTVAKKIFPDGSEEFVRGVDFVGTPLASLSNVIGVGNDHEVDNAYCSAESGTIPVSTISPAVLMANLELQAKDLTRMTSYALPMPWADGRQ